MEAAILVAFLFWCGAVSGQSGAGNFDVFVTQHPAVMTSGSDPARSQFGFSAAFHTTGSGDHFLLVGAPRDSYSTAAWRRPGVVEPGVLYRCTLAGSCQQLRVDSTDNIDTPSIREQKSFMRMGHSVASSGPSQLPLVCAPNFHLLWTCDQARERVVRSGGCFGHARLDLWDPTGKCVILPSDLTLSGIANNYQPCAPYQQPLADDQKTSLRNSRGTLFSLLETSGTLPYRFNLVGFALDAISDPSTPGNTLLAAGGPGYVFNEGQMYRATLNNESSAISDSKQFGSFANHLIDHFFAYDVTQGNLFGDNAPEIAVGMPRGQSIMDSTDPTNGDGSNRGEVRVFARSFGFSNQDQTTSIGSVILRIIGGQVAEHFGHVVHSEDTNADGFKELFVGAPMYTVPERIQDNYDHGRVAVFALKALSSTTFQQRLEISDAKGIFVGKTRARFGTAIISLGDLDYDGYNDIAISAPYEEGGVVYIYMGSRAGVGSGDSPVQRVAISTAAVRGMGFALSSRTDVDNNGFNDLAATALRSGHAVIIRSRPIINVTITITAPSVFDHTNRTCLANGQPRACFIFQVCGEYSLPQPTTLDATIPYTVDVTPRLSFASTDVTTQATGTLNLNAFRVGVCQSHEVFVEQALPDPCSPAYIRVISWNLVDVVSTNTVLTPILRRGPRLPVEHITQFVPLCPTCNPLIAATIDVSGRSVLNAIHVFDIPVEVKSVGTIFACSPTVTLSLASSSSLRASFDGVQTNRSSRYTCSPGGSGITAITCRQQGGLDVGNTNRFIVRVQVEQFGLGFTEDRTVNVTVLGSPTNANQQFPSNATQASALVSREARLQLSVVSRPLLVQIGSAAAVTAVPASLTDIPTVINSFLSVINAGPGAVPPFVIAAVLPISTVSGANILYLTNIRSTIEGVTCTLGNLLDPLSLASGGGDASNATYAVQNSASVLPRNLPCNAGNKVCPVEILCTIPLMQSGETVNITLAWRVLQGNARRSNLTLPLNVDLEMRLVNVTSVEGFRLTNAGSPSARASLVLTDGTLIATPDEGVNIWIIIGAVVGALALFAIVVLFLWKVGFFKRKRISKTERLSQSQPPQNGGNTVEAEADNEI